MQRKNIGALEQIGLVGRNAVTRGLRLCRGCTLAEDQNVHAEAAAGLGDQLTDRAEAENPQGRSTQPVRKGARPIATLHALRLKSDVAPRRKDQGHRQFGRRNGRITLAGRNRNAELRTGLEIDCLRIASHQCDQFQLWQPLQHSARELHALPYRDHDVGVTEALDQLIEIACRRAIADDLMVPDQIVAIEMIDEVLIIVRDYDLHIRKAAPWSRFSRTVRRSGYRLRVDESTP